jgi:L-methionine (R)-S-oxide reductase
MYEFAPSAHAPKPEIYAELVPAARALVSGESDAIANMANIAALIWQFLPDLNWAGFYRLVGDELVLGPFIGKPACIRIALGRGVCGTAAATQATQLVDDVHAFAGHIACDAASASELVVPVVHQGQLLGVIDLDSPLPARFDATDAAGVEALAAAIAAALANNG